MSDYPHDAIVIGKSGAEYKFKFMPINPYDDENSPAVYLLVDRYKNDSSGEGHYRATAYFAIPRGIEPHIHKSDSSVGYLYFSCENNEQVMEIVKDLVPVGNLVIQDTL